MDEPLQRFVSPSFSVQRNGSKFYRFREEPSRLTSKRVLAGRSEDEENARHCIVDSENWCFGLNGRQLSWFVESVSSSDVLFIPHRARINFALRVYMAE